MFIGGPQYKVYGTKNTKPEINSGFVFLK